MHFLVTGGSSDLAQTTVAQLLRRGHRVSWSGPALTLPAAGSGRLVRVTRRDVLWRAVDLRAVDGLVHLSGPHPSEHLDDADVRRTVEFSRALFERAAAAGIERVVTIGVVQNPRVEDQPFVRLKRGVEAALVAAGLPGVVFRAPWLYGPRDDFLTRLWRWVRNRSILLLPSISDAPVQLLGQERLADAIVRAVVRPSSHLRVYEAATTTPIPLSQLIEQLGRIVRGEPPRTMAVSDRSFYLRGPLKLVGLIPLRSPMWTLLEGGLTCATTAFERDFDIDVISPQRALIEFVRAMGGGAPWWGQSLRQLARGG